MFWHILLTPIIATFNALYNALPLWQPDLNQGWFHASLYWLGSMDKYFPIHDAFLPALTIAFTTFAALNAVKFVKWLLSLIPTISSAG